MFASATRKNTRSVAPGLTWWLSRRGITRMIADCNHLAEIACTSSRFPCSSFLLLDFFISWFPLCRVPLWAPKRALLAPCAESLAHRPERGAWPRCAPGPQARCRRRFGKAVDGESSNNPSLQDVATPNAGRKSLQDYCREWLEDSFSPSLNNRASGDPHGNGMVPPLVSAPTD